NEVGFHSEAWALSQGIDGSATLKKQRKALFIPSLPKVSSYLYKRILTYQSVYPAGSALVASLALGNRQSLSASHWDDFKRLGLSHLISVS
ncbi:ComEC/Rec2 family competence protein, partial [Neisseria sp. P0009.S003]|uniref:ComEC/Rec2 family competence protein n=1 Tax=Neisseria sp. P0009.S003 TaxID=3436710 RepID=UPI003F820902